MFTPLLAAVPELVLAGRGGGRGPGFIFPLLFLLLIGGLVFMLIKRRRHGSSGARPFGPTGPATPGPAPTGPGSALEVLQQRFARGDIDQAEYEHRKAVLVGADVVPPRTTDPTTPGPAQDGDPTTEIEPEQ